MHALTELCHDEVAMQWPLLVSVCIIQLGCPVCLLLRSPQNHPNHTRSSSCKFCCARDNVPITSSSHDPQSHHITDMAMAGRHADGGPSDEFVDAVDALLAAPEPPGVKKMVRMLLKKGFAEGACVHC
jgi:hypothetical protein